MHFSFVCSLLVLQNCITPFPSWMSYHKWSKTNLIICLNSCQITRKVIIGSILIVLDLWFYISCLKCNQKIEKTQKTQLESKKIFGKYAFEFLYFLLRHQNLASQWFIYVPMWVKFKSAKWLEFYTQFAFCIRKS